jgi:hypothetical protein
MAAALVAIAASGCGKKGPPRAPFIRIPAAVEAIEARRLGRDVYVSLTIPAANIDGSFPASVASVEVYGYTGTAPPTRARWAEVGSLVARVAVPPSTQAVAPGRGTPAPPNPAVAPPIALQPGGRITVVDTLTDDELVQGRLPVPDRRDRAAPPPLTPATPPSHPLPLRRYYVAYAFSPRGMPSPTGTPAEFILRPLPPPPPEVDARYTQTGVSLTWEPSGGLLGFLLDRALPDEPPIDDLDAPEPTGPPVPAAPAANIGGPTRYFVYREVEPDPLAPLPPPPRAQPPQGARSAALEDDKSWNAQQPVPETPTPLSTFSFVDTPALFGRARCYTIRSVRGVTELVVGDASPPFCFTPVDVFPPAPPTQLAAVASEGAISLIWEPNPEPDLGGHLVLRGAVSDATLQPLARTPIVEARYRDASTKPGERYVYAVIAVDNRLPVPNWSAESNRVEETAR